jgi:hypothetical protein
MEIKTWEDAEKASIQTGMSTEVIAKMFKIQKNESAEEIAKKSINTCCQKKLLKAIAKGDVDLMWEIHRKSAQESPEKQSSLKAILTKAALFSSAAFFIA